MLWVIFTILLGIAFWVGVALIYLNPKSAQKPRDEKRFAGLVVVGSALLIELILSFALSVHTVGQRQVGIVYNFYSRPEKGQKRRYGVAGHSFISVIDFGPQVEARSVLVFGESADPQSPHYFDQAKLYANREFKPAWFSLDEIKKHSERSYHPGEK